MKKHLKRILALACCLTLAVGGMSLAACGNKQDEQYSVVYDMNYDGGETRTVTVPYGAKAVSWNADRTGYTLVGWYTDKDCTKRVNFRKSIEDNITVYAKWEKKDSVLVSFDENYGGKHYNTVIENQKGKTVDEIFAPEVSRLGHIFTGWYKDKECTQKWDFETDTVSGDTTLYAGYKRDGSMKLDQDGKPVFENVTVNLWLGAGWDSENNNNALWNLAKRFNADPANKGKIHVNVTYDLYDQDFFTLRFQKTPNKNETDSRYYSVAEIYDLAGIEYSTDDWYEDAIKDSIVGDRLTSVPLVAGVPYIIYNKDLMKQYNGDSALPSTYTEFGALLDKVYADESVDTPDFKGIVTNTSDTYIEATSYAAFAQNGVDYFEFNNGKTENTWDSLTAAQTALTNTYEMFGKTGKYHGYYYGDDAFENGARGDVEGGKAFMGVVSWPSVIPNYLVGNDSIGIMPLSGLFADGEYKDRIPVHSLGLAFYKAQNLSTTELAAAGVFADYVSKNSYLFAQNGWYPVRKSVVESDEFQNSENDVVRLLKQTGNPENFYTLDGATNTWTVVKNFVYERNIVRAVNSETRLTEEDLAAMAEYLKKSIIDAR